MKRREVLTGMAALPIAGAATAAQMAAPQRVVASFSILADMVRRVGGGRVSVRSLVGPNADAHVYEPSAGDVRAVAEADLVMVNGLAFEGWMGRLAAATGRKDRAVVASAGVNPIIAGGVADPHAWHDPAAGVLYVRNIKVALTRLDPGGGALFQANARALELALWQHDRRVRAALGATPAARRTILTAHDAFAYFGRAYGVRFLAPEGLSPQEEPSARQVAALITEIRRKQVSAVFLENITDPRLVDQIARETGIHVSGELYSDALSPPGGPADSYLKLLTHNATLIASALGRPL